jgi:hypothetical protein
LAGFGFVIMQQQPTSQEVKIMRKQVRKILSVLLAVMFIPALLPASSSAASAINPKDTASFTPPDIFGEISTEIPGVYTPTNGGSGNVTSTATVSFGSTVYTPTAVSNTQGITIISQPTPSRTYTIGNTAANTYINGEQLSSTSLTISLASNETKYVQIITQANDTSNAYVNLVKFSRP